MRLTKLIAGVLVVWSFVHVSPALAATVNVSFQRPTARTDGSPLPASEIASYQINCTFTPTGGAAAPCAGLSPSSFPGSSLGGPVSFNASQDGQVSISLVTVDTAGRQSAPSNAASKPISIAPPNPPVNVTIAAASGFIQTPVFSLTANNSRGTYFGMIDLGKPCTGPVLFRYRSRDFREVSKSDVHFWGSTSLRVAAPCG